LIEIHNIADSSQTVVTAEGGTAGGLGGLITIIGRPDSLDQVQFQLLGNGTMDLSAIHQPSAIIGSLSGEGTVSLSNRLLDIGNNNLDTTFSGVLQERGGVIKSGSGTLTLAGANTYTGGTTVNTGTLVASNMSGSATGNGSVNVNAGTLGGSGIIQGAVTIGTGNGAGAYLAPSAGSNQPARLTLKKTLTFKADGIYTYQLNTNNNRADLVSARGVTIESGAQFNLQPIGNRTLAIGRVFTLINNTSANPIIGTFSNLPDGSTITFGPNNYQVSYEGGTGNDLTLTVVP
jgi:autotransporter-associated beta strand protein